MENSKKKSQNLWLLCGIPASGKSTFAAKQDGLVVSRDQIRFSLLKEGEDYFKYEDRVYTLFVDEIADAIEDGVENIYADATHLNAGSRLKLLKRLYTKDINVNAIVFNTPLEVCIERNSHRKGTAKVPEAVIRKMYDSFVKPDMKEFNYNKIIEVNYEG